MDIGMNTIAETINPGHRGSMLNILPKLNVLPKNHIITVLSDNVILQNADFEFDFFQKNMDIVGKNSPAELMVNAKYNMLTIFIIFNAIITLNIPIPIELMDPNLSKVLSTDFGLIYL